MSNSVTNISNPNAPVQNPANPAAPAGNAAPQADFKSQVSDTVQSTAPRDGDAPISPRIVVDPLAGPITEFLTTTGQVQAQIPSAAVVAYLRAGLTSAGFAKPTPEQTQQESDNKPKDNTNSVVA